MLRITAKTPALSSEASAPRSALVDEDAQLFSVIHVLHVRRVERDIEPEAFADNTVPAWSKLLVQRLLDRLRSFLQGERGQNGEQGDTYSRTKTSD